MQRLLLCITLVILLSGCHTRGQIEENRYVIAQNRVIAQYANAKLHKTPLPSKSLPRQQRLPILADRADAMAALNTKAAEQLQALDPPPKYQEVHSALVTMYDDEAINYRRWATAVRTGDKKKRVAASQLHGKILDRDILRLDKAQAALGFDAPAFRRTITHEAESGRH